MLRSLKGLCPLPQTRTSLSHVSKSVYPIWISLSPLPNRLLLPLTPSWPVLAFPASQHEGPCFPGLLPTSGSSSSISSVDSSTTCALNTMFARFLLASPFWSPYMVSRVPSFELMSPAPILSSVCPKPYSSFLPSVAALLARRMLPCLQANAGTCPSTSTVWRSPLTLSSTHNPLPKLGNPVNLASLLSPGLRLTLCPPHYHCPLSSPCHFSAGFPRYRHS